MEMIERDAETQKALASINRAIDAYVPMHLAKDLKDLVVLMVERGVLLGRKHELREAKEMCYRALR